MSGGRISSTNDLGSVQVCLPPSEAPGYRDTNVRLQRHEWQHGQEDGGLGRGALPAVPGRPACCVTTGGPEVVDGKRAPEQLKQIYINIW